MAFDVQKIFRNMFRGIGLNVSLCISILVSSCCNRETIIRTGEICKKIPLQKSVEFDMPWK